MFGGMENAQHNYEQIREDKHKFIETVKVAIKELEDKYPELRWRFSVDWSSSNREGGHTVYARPIDRKLDNI